MRKKYLCLEQQRRRRTTGWPITIAILMLAGATAWSSGYWLI
jgi:hypothetical protein